MASMQERVIRAAKLDPALYEEVEADASAMPQAMAVVVLSAVAAGIANFPTSGVPGILGGTLAALVAWYVWAFITYIVGTRLLPEPDTRADHGELLRTIGFASAPGLIRILGVVPFLKGPAFLVAGVWMLVAMVIAVRQALDYTSTWRAVAVCGVGWLVQLIFIAIVFAIFGG